MDNIEPTDNQNFSHQEVKLPPLGLLFHFVPILGFFPSLWTLYRGQGSREQIAVSRLSVSLALLWLIGSFVLHTTAETADFLALRLLLLNSFLTSGYFLLSLWLIIRLAQRKSTHLPGFSRFAERVVDKLP